MPLSRLLLACCLIGCGAPERVALRPVRQPAAPVIASAVELRISPEAERYNDRITHVTTPFAGAVYQELSDFARGAPVHDVRLDVAADAIARASTIASPSDGLVEYALRSVGVVESIGRVVRVATGDADEVSTRLIASAAGVLFRANVRIGVSSPADGQAIFMVVVYGAGVTLAPLPRSLPVGGSFEVTGILDGDFLAPRLWVGTGFGATTSVNVTATDMRAFRATVECARAGTRWITLEASGAKGPEVLAIIPVYCGTSPPPSFWVEPTTNVVQPNTDDEFERRIAAVAIHERRARGLTELASNASIARAAREHAQTLRAANRLAHDLGGNTMERLDRANLRPAFAVESVMKVRDLALAAEILLNDPAYRESLEKPEVTHVGVGVAPSGDAWFVVVIYVRIPPAIQTDAVRRELLASLRVHERIWIDPDLDRAAQTFAKGLAAGWSKASIWPSVSAEIPIAALHYGGSFSALVESAYEIDELDLARIRRDQAGDPRAARSIGIAVVQSARDGPLAGKTWVVVLSTGRRNHQRR